MSSITIGIGGVLIAMGIAGYAYTGGASWTALIPSIFGALLVVLGVLARNERLRMHVMHAAVLVGLIGLIVPAVQAGPKVPALISNGKVIVPTKDGGERDATVGVVVQLAMAVTCGVFVVLCVRSFIDARRSRAQREAGPAPGV